MTGTIHRSQVTGNKLQDSGQYVYVYVVTRYANGLGNKYYAPPRGLNKEQRNKQKT